jgi:predicted regulator of Ras-like GTPase activity (Roadblock/LC7/MglB family)
MAQKINQLLEQVRSELGTDLIATDVVGMDGISIAGVTTIPNFDTSVGCARFAMVMKLASKVGDKLAAGHVEENLASTYKGIVLSRLLGDGSYYWAVVLRKDATLGTARLIMREYAEQIWDAIPR